jgi:hypothetical protein
MAQVATQNQYVEDIHGIRRLVKGGQPVPNGLFAEGAVEVTEVDTRSLARPVIDEAASQPSGTAAEPNAGISLEHSENLRKAARGEGSGNKSSRSKSSGSDS